ncbi:glycoside hydrolase family 43 protein [Cryobacterium sp. GrIS_2_6]|uniref:glycoside hydrolase family 43 protein n=1 Tax=Cryobacterium sp. GrIS_2_6 TaxID=3162785 RepID=UPI002DF86669|nr:beta-xylosidase [Cryobacterium psychrotolerans]
MREPVHPRYFADPFVLRTDDGYVAYGTDPLADDVSGVFAVMTSPDLVDWTAAPPALTPIAANFGSDFWAPEVAFDGGVYWMYYSVGRGIEGHHIRVARSETALGPFTDLGVNLTPDEPFGIDAHPFRDADGAWYLFFARDRPGASRPGTQLAVARMRSMTELAEVHTALEPDADWQIYEHHRAIYGTKLNWHTLEGPSVIRHGGEYFMFFSGGSWEGDNYGVSFARAEHPLGPWHHDARSEPDVLSTALTGLAGPGHNSLVTGPAGEIDIAYHAWDATRTVRQAYIEEIIWSDAGPQLSSGSC